MIDLGEFLSDTMKGQSEGASSWTAQAYDYRCSMVLFGIHLQIYSMHMQYCLFFLVLNTNLTSHRAAQEERKREFNDEIDKVQTATSALNALWLDQIVDSLYLLEPKVICIIVL